MKGSGGLAGASIGLQVGATQPNSGSTLWSDIKPFDVTIACAKDQLPAGYTALGPAVSFGPVGTRLQREIPFSVPMNPAVMPDAATLRHVTVSYTGPRAKKPRAIPIANPRIVRTGAGYSLEFLAPWLGTYQAVVQTAGGTSRTSARKLASIRAAYKFFMRTGAVEINPAEALRSPKLAKDLPGVLSIPEVTALLEAPDTSDPLGLHHGIPELGADRP